MSEGNRLLLAAIILICGACSSVLKHEHSKEILSQDEFDKQVQVKELPAESTGHPSGLYVQLPGPPPVPAVLSTIQVPGSSRKQTKKQKKTKTIESASTIPSASTSPQVTAVMTHEPPEEDAEGFIGRRPKVDPFRIGEKVTLELSYFGVAAGEMNLEVRPFVQVNGRKSYHFVGTAVSSSVFAMFYAVDDWFETFVDYETLVPSSYALHVLSLIHI